MFPGICKAHVTWVMEEAGKSAAGKLSTEEATTNCLQHTAQGCPVLTTPLPCNNSDSPFLEMGNEQRLPPSHQQTAGLMPKDHTPWSAMPFLINFLIKKCHAGMRYEGSRLRIFHKIASSHPGVAEDLYPYRCL